jgi:hypothetical protein
MNILTLESVQDIYVNEVSGMNDRFAAGKGGGK